MLFFTFRMNREGGTFMEKRLTRRPPIEWPNKAFICVCVTAAFEAFRFHGHYTQGPGRGPGKLDHFSLSYADYGPKVGIWRIFDVLERNGIKATFDTGGLAAEKYPHIVKEMGERGHEVAGHGYANDIYPSDDDLEGELRDIQTTAKAIEASTGERPVGWVSPGSVGTSKTLQYMLQEGFLWNGDDASDDIPFVKKINGKKLVLLPRINFPTNDLLVWLNPQNPPGAYFNGFQETFEFMYDEGRRGRPMWIDLLLHSDMGARPALIGVFEKALRYAKGFERVWFARRRDIAEWVLKKDYE
jgi:peptidoglycan/xylan/chitin deacetylase (PgdA/CDA1 family)